VTTSSYGPDAYDFAKDKPLSLVDGPNLIAMLQKHGRRYRIDLIEARRLAAMETSKGGVGHAMKAPGPTKKPTTRSMPDRRYYYEVEKWSRDGQRVEQLLFAGNNLAKAHRIFDV